MGMSSFFSSLCASLMCLCHFLTLFYSFFVSRHGITEEDRPICVAFKVAVETALKSLSFPVSLRQESNWLNGLSYSVAVSDLPRAVELVKPLSFVSEVEVVGRMIRQRLDSESFSSSHDVQSAASLRSASSSGIGVRVGRGGSGGAKEISSVTSISSSRGNLIDLDYGDSLDQLTRIGIPPVHRMGYDGTGVVIAVLDSGFNTQHESLRDLNVVAAYDFVFNDTNVVDEPGERDASNHGTATWSNIGGKKPGQLYGGAYGASFILCKTEDVRSETAIEEDNFVRAIEFSERYGADILSASLGYDHWLVWSDLDGKHTVIARAGKRAIDLGLLFVVANGNAGMRGIGTPADMDRILSLGALSTTNEAMATFSSRGPTYDGRVKPEVSAPGVGVKVALFNNVLGYARLSGTSFATPLTAGVAALVLQVHPTWTNLQIREAIIKTSAPKGSPIPNIEFGYGVVSAINAIAYIFPTSSAASRCIAPNGTWNQTTNICDCAPGFYDTDCAATKLKCADYCQGVCTQEGECLCVNGVAGRCTRRDVTWTCPRIQFNDRSVCHCNCGLYDPDCKDSSLIITGCANAGDMCIELNSRGVCAPSQGTPPASTPASPPNTPTPSETPHTITTPSAIHAAKSHPAAAALTSILLTILNFLIR